MTQATEPRPVRARSGRRPIPPLIALLVLALVALFVWLNVFREDASKQHAAAAACSSAAAAPTSMDPGTITLRVFNANGKAGLAAQVKTTLESRGFVVSETANEPDGKSITGVGVLRFGARGAATAAFVKLFIPGATTQRDTRATSVVDVIVGPDFTKLASPDEVNAALAAPISAAANC